MRLLLNVYVFLFFSGLAFVAAGQEEPDNVMRRLRDIRGGEDIIEFYGLVLDQSRDSVGGATVTISVDQATVLPRAPFSLQVSTDENGAFQIDGKKDGIVGSGIAILAISKDGYEFKFAPGERYGFDYRKTNPNRYLPDKGGPVTFLMRKKGVSPVFLFEEVELDFEIKGAESGKAIGYDFVQRGPIRDVAKPSGDDAMRISDLKFKATFNMNEGTWTVVLSPGNADGGILVSEHLWYEAPETGYQPEYTFTPADRMPVKAKYVYLKSRDPAIYSRFEIQYSNAGKRFCRLSGASVTNPYGDRNLEQATDLPYEVVRQLTEEAKAAFRQNKRPSRPDLPRLIKEAKEKAGKDKGKP